MLFVSPEISIPEWELNETFIRATGPGGQNVNKVSTAVQLRFDVVHSPSLPEEIKQRLMNLAGNRMTKEGILVITAGQFRSQDQNRQEARRRLIFLMRDALYKPAKRIPTAPSKASKEKRLQAKVKQGLRKRLRRNIALIEDD